MNRRSNQASAGLIQRRSFVAAALPLALGLSSLAQAQEKSPMEKIRANGVLKIALYKDNQPYSDGSMAKMEGLDASLGEALAKAMQLTPAFLPFDAGENMGDDLRNMVWRGHYMGYGPADVMLHVPVDAYFMSQNRQAFIFAPYSREHLVALYDPKRLGQISAPDGLVGKKITAERGTGAASAMLGYRGGLLREQVVIFKSGMDAAKAVLSGQGDAAFVTLAQAESAIFQMKLDRNDWDFAKFSMPGVPPNGWPLGMAVKADNMELATQLDLALNTLRSSGELLKIFQSQGLTLAAP